MSNVTVLIPARDAGPTIGRAIRSVLSQTGAPIVLADDHSTDRTVEIARDLAGSRLRVTRPEPRGTVAAVRQAALAATSTPLAVWLDADDELLPGRVDRLVRALETDHTDFVWDAAEVVDGVSGRRTAVAPIPDFLAHARRPVRLFERNYLPAPGAPGVRVDTARRLGYDPVFAAAEDMDLVLRALDGGARIRLVPEPGYRVHAYPDSLSRRLDHQRRWYGRALAKHASHRVAALYTEAGYDTPVTVWALVSIAMYRRDWTAATHWLEETQRLVPHCATILEPDGPCPMPEEWRYAFTAGTIALMTAHPGAADWLDHAGTVERTPETLNNLGVARAWQGRPEAARDCFVRALTSRPGYADARANLRTDAPRRITTHPFRRGPTTRQRKAVARNPDC